MRLLSTGKSQSVNEYLSSWQSRYSELSPRIKDEESRESFKKIFKLFDDIDDIHKIDEQSEEMYFNAVLEKLVGNPVHVYSLLDRLVSLLPRVREELGQARGAACQLPRPSPSGPAASKHPRPPSRPGQPGHLWPLH